MIDGSVGLSWANDKDGRSAKDQSSVQVKKELISKASTHKKATSHIAKKRLQLGNIVYASIGPQVTKLTASGNRSRVKERVYGQIKQSIENKKYLVLSANNEVREMTSRSFKKADEKSAQAYHETYMLLANNEKDMDNTAEEDEFNDNEDPFRFDSITSEDCLLDNDAMEFKFLDNITINNTEVPSTSSIQNSNGTNKPSTKSKFKSKQKSTEKKSMADTFENEY